MIRQHKLRMCIIAVLLTGLPTLVLAQQNEPLPTMAELQQLMADKQWQPLLQKLSRVVSLRGAAAQQYDHYELLMMKAEAHTQLKANSAAIAAFNEAAKEPNITHDKAAIASASANLIKSSQGMVYKRKVPGTQPSDPKSYDVLDRENRKQAFAALAADLNSLLQSKAKAATTATNLRGVVDVLHALGDLKNAEIAAGDATPMADALLTPLVAHAKDLSSKALADDRNRVDVIEKSANTVIDVVDRQHINSGGYGGQTIQVTRYKKQGLIGNDMSNLKSLIQDCQTISAGDKQLADMFGDVGKPLLDVSAEADKLSDRAKVILNTDYSVTADNPSALK